MFLSYLGLSLTSCPDKWYSFDDYCYFKHDSFPTNNGTSWNDSRSACRNLEADLISITSQAEHQFIMNHIANNQHYWVGYTDEGQEGKWIWSDNTSSKFTKWRTMSNEPNNLGGNENCAVVLRDCQENGEWIDVSCAKKYAYICKQQKGMI